MGNFCPLSAGSAVQRARVHTPSGLRGIEPPTHTVFQVRCPLCKGLPSRSVSSCLVGHLCGNTSPRAAHKPSRASVPAPKPRGTQESTSVRWLPEGQVSSHVWPVMAALTLWAPGRGLGLQGRPDREAGVPRRANPAVLPVVASVPSLSPWSWDASLCPAHPLPTAELVAERRLPSCFSSDFLLHISNLQAS